MKKITTMLVMLLVSAATLCAQWSSDPLQNLKISMDGDLNQSHAIARETPDGKIFVSWIHWVGDMNMHIKLQLLDKNGNPMWEEGGIYVAQQQTQTWTGGYDMQVTPDGCAVIVHSDSRNDDTRNSFEPFAYKIDQEGNFLWGTDGVALPTIERQGLRPQIGVTKKGSVIVGYADCIGEYDMVYTVMKINEDGTLGWAMPLQVEGVFGSFYPCGDDDLYLTIFAGGGLTVRRIDAFGEDVWSEPLVVDKRDLNSRSEVFPVSDGKDGIILAYQRYVSLTEFYSCLQHVSPDGELYMGLTSVELSDEPAQHSAAGIGANPNREEIIAYWSVSRSQSVALRLQKFTYSGDKIWDADKVIEDSYDWGYAISNGTILDDGSFIMVYAGYSGSIDLELLIHKMDSEGNILWKKKLGPTAFMGASPSLIFDEKELFIFWSDDRESPSADGSGSIYGQNVRYADGDMGVAAVETIEIGERGFLRFNGSSFEVSVPYDGNLSVYNVEGELVCSANVQAGVQKVETCLRPGLYIARVTAANESETIKVLVR